MSKIEEKRIQVDFPIDGLEVEDYWGNTWNIKVVDARLHQSSTNRFIDILLLGKTEFKVTLKIFGRITNEAVSDRVLRIKKALRQFVSQPKPPSRCELEISSD